MLSLTNSADFYRHVTDWRITKLLLVNANQPIADVLLCSKLNSSCQSCPLISSIIRDYNKLHLSNTRSFDGLIAYVKLALLSAESEDSFVVSSGRSESQFAAQLSAGIAEGIAAYKIANSNTGSSVARPKPTSKKVAWESSRLPPPLQDIVGFMVVGVILARNATV